MTGVYDYTVLLTYFSLISANIGIFLSLGYQKIYAAALCLMLSGLFDAFDGKVARTKKNRTDYEKKFGIQIDSLTDIVAFGVLPVCIAVAMMRQSDFFISSSKILDVFCYVIVVLYVVTALIRLAHFNVVEDERQEHEGGVNRFYTGVPVTSASLLFPTILLVQYVTQKDLTLIYFIFIIVTSFAFISTVKVSKPKDKHIFLMIAIGVIEIAIVILVWQFGHKQPL